MKTLFLSARLLPRFPCLALSVVCALSNVPPDSHAATIYAVTIDTTALSGSNGTLAFDLTGGDAASANNTATLTNLATNGTLANASAFALTDTAFFNEVLRDVTFGTQLSFSLQLTENRTAPGFDQFSFFLLDSITLLPLVTTTDPTGANALFAIDVTGTAGGTLQVFSSVVPNVSWNVSAPAANVPDTSSTLLLTFGAFGALGLCRVAVRML